MSAELLRLIDMLEKDKGIKREIIVETLESALVSAAKKAYGHNREIEAKFSPEDGEILLYEYRKIAETITDPDKEISLEDAKEMDPGAEIGDSIGVKLNMEDLGRIAAQAAKQVIMQKMKDAEREIIYNEFKTKQGEVVTGTVRRFEGKNIVVDLGKTEAYLLVQDQIPRENYSISDRIRAFVLDISQSGKGPQILLSRTHEQFLVKLFKMEVPEIHERIVEIKNAAREPGARAKIAVYSSDPDVDPVGACVGMKGARVQSVVQELRGEKIDIVPWSSDPVKFAVAALAPAKISEVMLDETGKSMQVIVPDDQLSLAIGRKGQNVRLAAILTKYKIDIISESKVKETKEEAHRIFTSISEVGEKTAEMLYNAGVKSLDSLAEAPLEILVKIPGIGPKMAERIKIEAQRLIELQKGTAQEKGMAQESNG